MKDEDKQKKNISKTDVSFDFDEFRRNKKKVTKMRTFHESNTFSSVFK